jgi:hypothetical protein
MKNYINFFHWLPRVLCILAILFISLFSMDAFEPGLSTIKQIGAFIIHLAPTFMLIAALVIAWKWEKMGGILFVAIGLAFTPFVFMLNYHHTESVWISILILFVLNFPFILVGGLFLVSNHLKNKAESDSELINQT